MTQRRQLKARQLYAKSSTAACLRRFTMFAVSSMQMRSSTTLTSPSVIILASSDRSGFYPACLYSE
eukprot:531829-Pleurochrysis_carterae.AAC.1